MRIHHAGHGNQEMMREVHLLHTRGPDSMKYCNAAVRQNKWRVLIAQSLLGSVEAFGFQMSKSARQQNQFLPREARCYFRQNDGVRITSTVSSSRRPSNIAIEQTQVWKSVSIEKFSVGPTSCNPGPILFSEATLAENAVSASRPDALSTSVVPTSVASQ